MSLFTPALLSIAWAVTRAVIILLVSVLFAASLSFSERRVLAWWQDRYGRHGVWQFGPAVSSKRALDNPRWKLDETPPPN